MYIILISSFADDLGLHISSGSLTRLLHIYNKFIKTFYYKSHKKKIGGDIVRVRSWCLTSFESMAILYKAAILHFRL